MGARFLQIVRAVTLAIIILAGIKVHAQDHAALIGLTYGIGVPDAPNTNPHYMFGVTGTAQLDESFSFGGYYYMNSSEQGSGARNFNVSLAGVQAFYVVPKGAAQIFFGGKLGITKLKTVGFGSNVIMSPFHYGIGAGSDYYIYERITIGVEGFFLRNSDDTIDVGTQKFRENPFNIIGFMVTVKLAL